MLANAAVVTTTTTSTMTTQLLLYPGSPQGGSSGKDCTPPATQGVSRPNRTREPSKVPSEFLGFPKHQGSWEPGLDSTKSQYNHLKRLKAGHYGTTPSAPPAAGFACAPTVSGQSVGAERAPPGALQTGLRRVAPCEPNLIACR